MPRDVPLQELESQIPHEVRAALEDLLTERGMGQWWNARNRLLDGNAPVTCWEHVPNRRFVIAAANAFGEGVYV